jgi:S-adenosylmethionine:tRNA ribosyltransferase-isomerase
MYPASPSTFDESLSSMRYCSWYCSVGNAKRWKDETLEKILEYDGNQYRLSAKKIELKNDFLVTFEWDAPVNFSKVLDCCGNIPIPPYLKRDSEQIDESSYQTVFSKFEGSIAAPTAGLHFTARVMNSLTLKGINLEEITLHVGAGTFKPMKGELVHEHEMHKEIFIINRKILEHLHDNADNLIAVGTTSARMLESLYWLGVSADSKTNYEIGQWEAYGINTNMTVKEAFARLINKLDSDDADEEQASTEIMIVPGYKFRTIKGLITNFHQPESTLILLVAAFTGNKWKEVYDYALANDFRFLSYGDCSLLIP